MHPPCKLPDDQYHLDNGQETSQRRCEQQPEECRIYVDTTLEQPHDESPTTITLLKIDSTKAPSAICAHLFDLPRPIILQILAFAVDSFCTASPWTHFALLTHGRHPTVASPHNSVHTLRHLIPAAQGTASRSLLIAGTSQDFRDMLVESGMYRWTLEALLTHLQTSLRIVYQAALRSRLRSPDLTALSTEEQVFYAVLTFLPDSDGETARRRSYLRLQVVTWLLRRLQEREEQMMKFIEEHEFCSECSEGSPTRCHMSLDLHRAHLEQLHRQVKDGPSLYSELQQAQDRVLTPLTKVLCPESLCLGSLTGRLYLFFVSCGVYIVAARKDGTLGDVSLVIAVYLGSVAGSYVLFHFRSQRIKAKYDYDEPVLIPYARVMILAIHCWLPFMLSAILMGLLAALRSDGLLHLSDIALCTPLLLPVMGLVVFSVLQRLEPAENDEDAQRRAAGGLLRHREYGSASWGTGLYTGHFYNIVCGDVSVA